MTESLGKNIANYDNKIKDVLTTIINNKEETIDEYKKLKHSLHTHTYDEVKRTTLEKLLNKRRQQFEYALTLKNKQNEALLKLLEYLYSLEKKDKNFHIRQTLDMMKKLDNEITIINDLIK